MYTDRQSIQRKALPSIVLMGTLLILLCLGCAQPLWHTPPLPDFAPFQEGDIVLTFSGAVESWGLALCTQDPNDAFERPYTHAEAIFRNTRGDLMLGGVSAGRVRARKLKNALREFQHIAVYRSRCAENDRQRVGALLEQWTKDRQFRKAAFDYTLQDVPGRRDAFCCVGFINEAYRTASIAPPFIQTSWTPNAAAQHLGEFLQFEFTSVILVDSVTRHADFGKVLEWENAMFDPEQSALMREMATQALIWYEEGWKLKTSDAFNLGYALIGLPQHLEQTDRTRSQLRLFSLDVLDSWSRLKRRGRLKGLNETQKEELRQAVFHKHRDRYFYRHEGTPL